MTIVTIYTAYINTPISFFSEKHSKRTGFSGRNSDILTPPPRTNSNF